MVVVRSVQADDATASINRAEPHLGSASRVIIVLGSSRSHAESLAECLRRDGISVYVARTSGGCLRMATAFAVDTVILDGDIPDRIPALLRHHPTSARARIVRMPCR